MKSLKIHYGGLIGFWLDLFGFGGITFGSHVWLIDNSFDHLIPHEKCHILQYEKFGIIGFIIIYLLSFFFRLIKCWNFKQAYLDIPWEKEAREMSGGKQINDRQT